MEKSIFDVFMQYGAIGVICLLLLWYHFKYSAKRFDDQDKREEKQNAILEKVVEAVATMNHSAELRQKDSELRQRMYEDRIDGLEKIVTDTCLLIRETREAIMYQNNYVSVLLNDNLGLRAFLTEEKDRRSDNKGGASDRK
jgi:undecaprenyl pyrophosphate phosphatase UppP